MIYIRITSDVSYDHIYYTLDGSDPTPESIEYKEPFEVYNNCTIKARSYKDDWVESDISVLNLLVPVSTPQVARIDGVTNDYCTITILNRSEFNQVEGLKFYYTLDGSDPVIGESEWFSINGLTVRQNGTVKILGSGDSSSPSLKLVEVKIDGLQCQKPEPFTWFDPETREVEVSFKIPTEGASVYYTLDGSTPGEMSYPYAGKFKVDYNCTLKAVSAKDGLYISNVASQEILVVLPIPSPFYRENTGIVVVSNLGSYDLTTTKIVYTIDGSEPTPTSKVYDPRKGISVSPGTTVKLKAYGIQNVDSETASFTIPEK